MPNRVGHFEIHADDPERCANFYRTAFGWEIKKWDGPFEYWMVVTGADNEPGGINGGIVKRGGQTPPMGSGMNGYCCSVIVDNFDEYAMKILEHGGKEALPKMALTGLAWQGYFIDTEGNTFGLHQPDKEAK